MWTELALILAMLVAFGFAVPYIGSPNEAMPKLTENWSNVVCTPSNNDYIPQPDCACGPIDCKVEWYFWCIV